MARHALFGIEPIEQYRTMDGKVHATEDAAVRHVVEVVAQRLTELLNAKLPTSDAGATSRKLVVELFAKPSDRDGFETICQLRNLLNSI